MIILMILILLKKEREGLAGFFKGRKRKIRRRKI